MISEKQPAAVEPALPAAVNITLRALILAVLFTLLASYWIDTAEVVTLFCQITESVPAIPAVAFLVVLVVANPLLRQLAVKWALSRSEIVAIYVFLTVATSMAGCGIARFFINILPVLFYFDTPENDFTTYQGFLPNWMVPHDREIIRQLYEGSPSGHIPWGAWAGPLLAWGVFFVAFWIAMMSITVIFRRQWAEKEKLVYPLLYLPLEVTDNMESKGMVASFFRNPVMWIGFGAAFVFNLANFIKAYNPSFTALGQSYDLGQLFTEYPLSALRPLTLHYRPEMIGFGYLVSTEVSLSVWVFYALFKVEKILAVTMGFQKAIFPAPDSQSIGAYLAMGLMLIWVARSHLADVFRKAFTGDPKIKDSDEPMPYRLAVIGCIVGIGVSATWMVMAGMAPALALTYIGLILLVALVYTRIRAEVGVPLIWMFPFYQHFNLIKYALGSRGLMYQNSWRSGIIFSTFVFLSRGYYPSLMGYQAEGFRICRETGIKPRSMSWNLLLAVIVGFYIAVWLHLRSYYAFGAGGVRALEGWGAGMAKNEFQAITNYTKSPVLPDVTRLLLSGLGFASTAGLVIARMFFLKFPLHPLGFCMASSYGDLVWGSFFLVWLIKTVVFKLGGMRGYRQLIPGFMGLALGHFFTAGVIYSLVGSYGGEEWRRYAVWFG